MCCVSYWIYSASSFSLFLLLGQRSAITRACYLISHFLFNHDLIFPRRPRGSEIFLQLLHQLVSSTLQLYNWAGMVHVNHAWRRQLSVYACLSILHHQLLSLTVIYRASSSASALLWSLSTRRNNKWINLFSICRREKTNIKHCVIALYMGQLALFFISQKPLVSCWLQYQHNKIGPNTQLWKCNNNTKKNRISPVCYSK